MGSSYFQPNCTLPPSGPTFVSKPIRGTLDIVWSCVSLFVLCSWSVLHLNVPFQARPRSRQQRFNRFWHLTARKIRWMLTALMCPEYNLGTAIAELVTANWNRGLVEEWAERDSVEWSLRHSIYANMGGFAIKFDHLDDRAFAIPEQDEKDSQKHRLSSQPGSQAEPVTSGAGGGEEERPRNDSEPDSFGALSADVESYAKDIETSLAANPYLKIAYESLVERLKTIEDNIDKTEKFMGESGWAVSPTNRRMLFKTVNARQMEYYDNTMWEEWLDGVAHLEGNIWVLNGPQFLYARSVGIIDRLPDVSRNELDNESNSDSLVKTLALVQVIWLIVQVIVRSTNKLPISQLEVLALAFAVFSLFTYGFLWPKPQDAQVAKFIQAARHPTVHDIMKLEEKAPSSWGDVRSTQSLANNYYASYVVNLGETFPLPDVAWAISGLLFGAVHCIAWDFQFPSFVECVFWRVSALAQAVLSLTYYASQTLYSKFPAYQRFLENRPALLWLIRLGLYLQVLAYVVARLFIIVEAFRSLGFLPAEAFLDGPLESDIIPKLS